MAGAKALPSLFGNSAPVERKVDKVKVEEIKLSEYVKPVQKKEDIKTIDTPSPSLQQKSNRVSGDILEPLTDEMRAKFFPNGAVSLKQLKESKPAIEQLINNVKSTRKEDMTRRWWKDIELLLKKNKISLEEFVQKTKDI